MRRRALSEEETALWLRATRDVTRAGRALPLAAEPAPPPARLRVPPPPRPAPSPAARKTAPAHFVYGGGDPARDRAAATGRLEIERTLDLHGLTQDVAHRFLERFILGAAEDGVRLALVITGKGRPAAADTGAKPGILRTRFLDWIEEAPLKAQIARVAPAKVKDGGAGAFYVFLKKKGAGRSPRP